MFESYVCSHDDLRVHVDVQSEARLVELEAITRRLSTGELKTIRLSELRETHWVSPLAEVVLAVSARGSDVRNRQRGSQMFCEWSESKNGWLESAEKIAQLRVFNGPGHQYFEGPHADSVTIELAYKE